MEVVKAKNIFYGNRGVGLLVETVVISIYLWGMPRRWQ